MKLHYNFLQFEGGGRVGWEWVGKGSGVGRGREGVCSFIFYSISISTSLLRNTHNLIATIIVKTD